MYIINYALVLKLAGWIPGKTTKGLTFALDPDTQEPGYGAFSARFFQE